MLFFLLLLYFFRTYRGDPKKITWSENTSSVLLGGSFPRENLKFHVESFRGMMAMMSMADGTARRWHSAGAA